MKNGTCKHFNGVQNNACKLGVAYDSLPGFPCIKTYGKDGPRERVNEKHCDCCAKYEEPTAEEIANDKAERDASLAETEKRILAATPKNKTKPYNVWFDETAPGEEFTHEQFLARLQSVHGIDPKATKGKRSMVCHMDGDTWFSYVWEWEIAGKKFTNSTRQNRSPEDAAMWA